MLHTTRKILLATCIAAIPGYALAQSGASQTQHNNQQNAPRSSAQMSGKFLAAPQSGQMRAADLRDADVYTSDNQKVGDIDDILLDRQGKIVAVVVGVGGFLGIGEKNVAIPFDSLEMQDPNAMAANTNAASGSARSTTTTTERDRMSTGAVPDNRTATDQDRQRTTAQRAEDMSREQANRQGDNASAQRNATTTTTTTQSAPQRTAQASGNLWKVERILLKGVTKADLQAAPEFKWDASATSRSNTSNQPARNR